MTANNASLEVKLRLRAYYLWEADGCPEGRFSEYWQKAQAMLDDEATIWAPVDEATAAGTLLTKRPHDPHFLYETALETGGPHLPSDVSEKKR